jgi:hypothetical protein
VGCPSCWSPIARALHAGGGRPTDAYARLLGELAVGHLILEPRDCQAKGLIENRGRYLRTNFEPGRVFANELDCQDQLDRWCDRVNAHPHRTLRCRPIDRLAAEREALRALPERVPDTDRRLVTRVPPDPHVRVDRNDYSLDPLVGERVELRVSQRKLLAISLRTGELCARHRRVFAGGLTLTAPEHAKALRELRRDRRSGREIEVETRPPSRYDALIPA